MSRAVYPGSFDPITNGHIDIAERASKIFNKVTLLVAVNSEKNPLFDVQERVKMIRQATQHLDNVDVDWIQDCLLVDYLRKKGIGVVVKGLRAVTDFEYEFQMALMNRNLNAHVETVFLVTQAEHAFLSSSIVKEVARLGGDVSDLVPDNVNQALRKVFGKGDPA